MLDRLPGWYLLAPLVLLPNAASAQGVGTPQFTELGEGAVRCWWTPAEGAISYRYEYGSNAGAGARVGTTEATEITLRLPDDTWFCVEGVGPTGVDQKACNTYRQRGAPLASKPPPPAGSPALAIDFDDYENTEQLLSDHGPRGSGKTFEATGEKKIHRISLVTDDGPPGHRHSMQYDWELGDEMEITISRFIDFENHGIDPYTAGPGGTKLREVWAEVWVKLSDPFGTVANHRDQGLVPGRHCLLGGGDVHRGPYSGKNPSYKFFFINQLGGQGRSEMRISESYNELWRISPIATDPDFTVIPPGSNDGKGAVCHISDERWHPYRFHFAFGPPGESAGNRARFWLDEHLLLDEWGSWATLPNWDRYYGITLGANMNRGPEFTQWLRWGSVKLWTTDPGW